MSYLYIIFFSNTHRNKMCSNKNILPQNGFVWFINHISPLTNVEQKLKLPLNFSCMKSYAIAVRKQTKCEIWIYMVSWTIEKIYNFVNINIYLVLCFLIHTKNGPLLFFLTNSSNNFYISSICIFNASPF